ncbi:hypothetical protein EXW96_25140 [Paenibacillus sp. JMULE4]|uniref:hypothetical protein n=1 Tax=Paenibacillus sp. JMULE4 TaxID=2518342 RepID=UPI001575487B|nr:hypothetical protein [Paenibacillus sp. JMULE4]NTZ20679.1 hypothetical protein [Paenibacillus sp. JMULE4]
MNLLDQWKDEYLSQDETYRNHVTKFVAFINNIEKANQPITITKEDLIESVGYYHRLGKIKTIKTMESHVESVKAFYKYIVGKGYADDIFNNTASFQEFKTFIINKYNLTGVKDKDFWEADMIIEILENLDDYFERTNYSELDSRSKKRFFKFLVLRLFIN